MNINQRNFITLIESRVSIHLYIIEVKKKRNAIFLQENLNSVERFFRIPLYVEKQGNKDVNYSAKIAMESFINDTMIID